METTDDLLRMSNEQFGHLKESTARIGLFWFSHDYSKIIRIESELEISNADLIKSGRIDPIGLHAEYDMPRDTPRGRVCYENNNFKIWIGEDCLIDDESLITMIKNKFNLKKINSNRFIIKRHYHWNTKN